MKRLAIIPARGGSKRIPGKNIRPFLGKPIIAYTIEQALGSLLFDEVMVSTDSQEIAEIALEHGAKVPFIRSSENSGDHATIADVVEEVIKHYHNQGFRPEVICCLFATSPFLTKELLEKGLSKVSGGSGSYDSAFSVQKFEYPIFRALRKSEQGNLEMYWPEYLNSRSQDLPQAFHDAGQFYFIRTEVFSREKSFFVKNSFGIELSGLQAQDIDTEEDWRLAELKFKMMKDHQ